MPSPLDNLAGPGGPLTPEPPDAKEFAGLLEAGRAQLRDVDNPGLAPISRFNLAYGAAHAFSVAALRYRGYRSTNRYVVFQALQHTLGLGPGVWRVLDLSHTARNANEYRGSNVVDPRLLVDLIAACRVIAAALDKLPKLG